MNNHQDNMDMHEDKDLMNLCEASQDGRLKKELTIIAQALTSQCVGEKEVKDNIKNQVCKVLINKQTGNHILIRCREIGCDVCDRYLELVAKALCSKYIILRREK